MQNGLGLDIKLKISIHAPRMGSDNRTESLCIICNISIHPPHGERRADELAAFGHNQFQFSLPAWGAMDLYFHVYINLEISIHAPRMGSDVNQYALVKLHFIFQFTLPAWGAIILLRVIIST